MDADVNQQDKGWQDEDHGMGDASAQEPTLPPLAPSVTPAPSEFQGAAYITNIKFAPPSSEPDLTPSEPDLPPSTPHTSTTTITTAAAAAAAAAAAITTPTNPASPPSTNPNTTILETTEKPAESQKMPPKKKGTAAMKRAPKRRRGGGHMASRPLKKQRDGASTASATSPAPDNMAGGSEEESDNGPYCICRGPDDHRFMISCDLCEDWFHGECVNIAKDIGENLIERFVCPNCTDGVENVSLFKKTCSYKECKKAARLYDVPDSEKSAFCSNEHSQMWWEQRIAALPKKKPGVSADAPQNGLTQAEIMHILTSDLARVDPHDNKWRVETRPLAVPVIADESPKAKIKSLAPILTEEEKGKLEASAAERRKMGEEIVLCQDMLNLLEWANDRRKSLIASKQLEEACCGYDFRLDQVGVSGPFSHWHASVEAKEILEARNLDIGSRLSGDGKNICDKKRCKPHSTWYFVFTRDVKHQMKLLADEAGRKVDEEERIKRSAAERKLRKEAENNTVQRVSPDGMLLPPEAM